MATLIYAPEIQVVIDSWKHGIIDVSDDITDGNLSLVEKGSHSFSVGLLNVGRKYDGVFAPNDRIVVYMKRIKKLLVFTGYLDSVPLFSIKPRTVQLNASCTLKRIKHRYWDPGTAAAADLLTLTGAESADALGIKDRVIKVLTDVVGWDSDKIHIGRIPNDWFDEVVRPLWREVSERAQVGGLLVQPEGSIASSGALGLTTIPGNGPGTGYLRDYEGLATYYVSEKGALGTPGHPTKNADGDYWYAAISGLWAGRAGDNDPPLWNNEDAARIRQWWKGRKLIVTSNETGKAICVRAHDFMEASNTDARKVIDLSPEGFEALGVDRSRGVQQVSIRFAPSDTYTLGPITTRTTDSGRVEEVAGPPAPTSSPTSNNRVAQFLQLALAQVGDVYAGAGNHGESGDLNNPDPSEFDCSGLVYWALGRLGITNPHGSSAATYYQWCLESNTHLSESAALRVPGALLFKVGGSTAKGDYRIGHVGISLGNGADVLEASGSASGVVRTDIDAYSARRHDPGYWEYGGMIPGLTVDYASLIQDVDLRAKVIGTPAGSTAGLFGDVGNTPLGVFQSNGDSDRYVGLHAIQNDQPVIGILDSLLATTMRSYCAAPNGDFIAWFPDYFGRYNMAGKMVVQDIELMSDFSITWDDERMRTHHFAVGTETVANGGLSGGEVTIDQAVKTGGIATVEFPEILHSLFGITSGEPRRDVLDVLSTTQKILDRFGARPYQDSNSFLTFPEAEFWLALNNFQRNWAEMFNANVALTFMPELFPGMLLQIPSVNFQAYVTSVNHSFSLTSGFTTSVSLIAPSHMNGQGIGALLAQDAS